MFALNHGPKKANTTEHKESETKDENVKTNTKSQHLKRDDRTSSEEKREAGNENLQVNEVSSSVGEEKNSRSR